MSASPTSRDKLLIAALDLLVVRSYGHVSVDDICAASGVKKGSFYHYFPSKSDLVLAAFEHAWTLTRPALDAMFSPSLSPAERLHAFVTQVIHNQQEKRQQYGKVVGCVYATCGLELAAQDDRIREKSEEIFLRYARYFEPLLREAWAGRVIDEAALQQRARMMQSFITGQIHQAKITNSLEGLAPQLQEGLRLLMVP